MYLYSTSPFTFLSYHHWVFIFVFQNHQSKPSTSFERSDLGTPSFSFGLLYPFNHPITKSSRTREISDTHFPPKNCLFAPSNPHGPPVCKTSNYLLPLLSHSHLLHPPQLPTNTNIQEYLLQVPTFRTEPNPFIHIKYN